MTGEAKRRQRHSARVREAQPYCIFCGGAQPSETVEHYPPKIIFRHKLRPKGMEFGACRLCNGGSAHADQVVGLLSRIYPDAGNDLERVENSSLIKAVERSTPGLLAELRPIRLAPMPQLDHLPTRNFLNLGGPKVTAAFRTFGAKLGLALHFKVTGRIVPWGGAVAVNLFSNLHDLEGQLPHEFLSYLGAGITLSQGRFSVEKQFRFASMVSDDSTWSGHFAVFREAFGLQLIVGEDTRGLDPSGAVPVGFLRKG